MADQESTPVDQVPSSCEEEGVPDDELTYDPVPPKKVFTVRVKYRFVGRMKPMPYQLDE